MVSPRSPSTTPTRLFFALWPGDEIRPRLAALIPGVVESGRAVRRENLHITLLFLGKTPADRRHCYEQAASEVRGCGFELRLDRLQWRARAGMIWLSAENVPEALEGLVTALASGLRRCGFAPELRPFRAHVTLARDVRRARRPDFEPVVWPVSEFCLVGSELAPGGSRYTVLRRWPLG